MCHGRVRSAISLDQNEPGGVILLLQKIEAENSRLLSAFARIEQRCLFERLNAFRLYPDMNMTKHKKSKSRVSRFGRAFGCFALKYSGFNKRIEVLNVARFFHFLDWDEPERCGINAIP